MLHTLSAALFAALMAVSSAATEKPSDCTAAPLVLWGDGEHDDTAALNAWFRGETVLWAQTHEAVGSETAGRSFLLGSTVYLHGGPAPRRSGSAWVGRIAAKS